VLATLIRSKGRLTTGEIEGQLLPDLSIVLGANLRILTLNIQHGGGRRISQILNYLEAKKPDVAVLTEFRRSSRNSALVMGLAALGYVHLLCAPAGADANSVAIASRHPITEIALNPAESDRARVVGGILQDVSIIGVYFAGNLAKRSLFEFLIGSNQIRSTRSMLIGDFNTGLHRCDEAGATFFCTDEFAALQTTGWIDLWRSQHGVDAREFSWFSPAGNGFRIDHAFGSPLLASHVSSCAYDHSTRGVFTDHSAMALQLSL
jgi:exodeoxyribonuclease III